MNNHSMKTCELPHGKAHMIPVALARSDEEAAIFALRQ